MLPSKPRSQRFRGISAAVLYGCLSISITFFNKAVLTAFNFKYPNFMTLCQMSCSLLFLVSMKALGLITYPDFDVKTAKRVSPLAFSFIGMVITGLGALNYLNIPMFNALRNTTTLITMACEFYFLGIRSTGKLRSSVYLMVAGAAFAGLHDLTFNAIGYFLVALNCFFTSGYLLYIAKFGQDGLNSWGLLFYNNLLSLPMVVIICIFSGDFQQLSSYEYLSSPSFLVCFFFQSCLAFLLNYAIFLCTNLNSALTTSVTGQVKNLMTTGLGFFMFGDVKYNPLNIVGLFISLFASSIYSWLKYVESEVRKANERQKAELASILTPKAESDHTHQK